MTTGSGSSKTRTTAAKSSTKSSAKTTAKTTGTTRSRSAKAKADPPAEIAAAPQGAPEVGAEPARSPLALLALEEIAAHVMRAIVSNHKALSIVRYNEPDKVRIAISVAPEDLGKVIGKQGRTINALRAIVKMAAAARSDTQVAVDLEGRPA